MNPPSYTPKIEGPNKSSNQLIFTGVKLSLNKPAPQPSPPSIQIQPPTSQPSVEKVDKSLGGLSISGVRMPDFDSIMAMLNKDHNGKKFTRASKGYIALTNFIKNIQTSSNSPQQQRRPQYGYKNRAKDQAELSERDDNRFVPQSMMKNADVWVAGTKDEFSYNVNLTLNRLTDKKLQSTVEELEKHVNDIDEATKQEDPAADQPHDEEDDRITSKEVAMDIICDVLCEKAQEEHGFSDLYAQFTKSLSDDELRSKILVKTFKTMEDFHVNLPTSDEEGTISCGTAKFLACLINHKVIDVKTALDLLAKLLKCIVDSENNSYLIEMLEVFLKNAGKDFMCQVEKEQWDIFDQIVKSVKQTTRLGCLLMNIVELKSEWVDNQTVKVQAAPAPAKTSNSSDIVRNSYCDFCEGSELAKIPLDPGDYLLQALHQLPDHVKDANTYGLFLTISISLANRIDKPLYQEITEVLKKFTREITENNMIEECPKIWVTYYQVLVALYAFNRFDFKFINEIFPQQTAKDKWYNECRYFIYDNCDFTRAYKISQQQHNEINDALSMPDIIDQRTKDSPLSRLTAVATCRTVMNKAFSAIEAAQGEEAAGKEKAGETLTKYSQQLLAVYQKFPSVFDEEFETAVNEYEFPLDLEQIKAKIGASQ